MLRLILVPTESADQVLGSCTAHQLFGHNDSARKFGFRHYWALKRTHRV